SAAHQLCRSAQKDLSFPTHPLHSARGMYLYGRLRLPARYRSYGRGARARSRGLSLSHAALKEARFEGGAVFYFYELDVDAVFEVMMAAYLGCFGLPAGKK